MIACLEANDGSSTGDPEGSKVVGTNTLLVEMDSNVFAKVAIKSRKAA